MKIDEFIATYVPKFSEYCPVVIDEMGLVFECKASHLLTLEELAKERGMGDPLPFNVSPLFYYTSMLKCVSVDFENQLYSGKLTVPQEEAIAKLVKAKLIEQKLQNIGERYFL